MFASVSICVYLWLIFLPSCSSKPTNLRTLAPADSLIYLETNDRLLDAIHLYEQLGFRHLPPKTSEYTRANVFMELVF